MRNIGQLNDAPLTPAQRQLVRFQTTDTIRIRGTSIRPPAPREVTVQSAPRGVLVNWSLPDPTDSNTYFITGWRVYKNDEKTLYAQIKDRGTRSQFVECTSGATPPVTNIFVSSVNAQGTESVKAYAQGTAMVEAGAPAMPDVPPAYNDTYSGGGNQDNESGHYGGGRGGGL